MKKNKIFNGLGAKLALAVMALTSSLFTSCEKEDFNATFETEAAKAIIAVSAYDAESGDALTPTIISTSAGTASGTEVTIVGNKDIAKQTVTVKIQCNDLEGEGIVEIPALKAGSVGHYSITFLVGKTIEQQPPVYENAKAVITATAVDGKTGEALEGATFTFESTVEGGTAEGNVFTIVGNKDIKAQTVTVTATYEDLEPAIEKIEIPALNEGTVNNYNVIFRFYEGDIETVTYVLEKGEPVSVNGPRNYLTGNYTHTHNGIDQWLSNDTDYLLDAVVTYKAYTGVAVTEKNIVEASDFVNELIASYEQLGGIKEVDAAMTFKVSAWSLYAAWTDVTTTTTAYAVKKVVNGVTQEAAVATFALVTKSVVADHMEIAHPDHSHAYVHGHGHGHGNGNAGGGIVMPD